MKYNVFFFLWALLICCQYNCSEVSEKVFDPGMPTIIIGCSLPTDYYKQPPSNPLHKDIRELFLDASK